MELKTHVFTLSKDQRRFFITDWAETDLHPVSLMDYWNAYGARLHSGRSFTAHMNLVTI